MFFLFVCIVSTLHFELDIMWTFSIQSLFIQNKIFECDNNVDPKEIWNRIDQRRACTKNKLLHRNAARRLCATISTSFSFVYLFVCFGFDLSSSFNSICVLMLICFQQNNDIGHMISIAIIQLLPKRAAFILFISASLFALFLSLSLTVHCNGFFFWKSMLFCQFCWRFFSSSKLFKHILCALQILQLLAILKANTFHLNILWLFGWLCIHMFVLCFEMNEFIKIGISTWIYNT